MHVPEPVRAQDEDARAATKKTLEAMDAPFTHRCSSIAEGLEAVHGGGGIGFAIFPINVWSSDPAQVQKAVEDPKLWKDASAAVGMLGRGVFQTYSRDGEDFIPETEGGQRLQAVVGPSTPRRQEGLVRARARHVLHEVSNVFDLHVPALKKAFSVRESAVMKGERPKYGHSPKAQMQHSDNSVPDNHNALLIGAGSEPVGLWVWTYSQHIVCKLEASGHTLADFEQACKEVDEQCQSPVYVLLQPGEMIMLHGNVIHAGARLGDHSVTGAVRVHKYMVSVDAPSGAVYEEDSTVLLALLGSQENLPLGTRSLDSVFGRFYDRGAGGV
jgi:hypothetical protein